MQIWFVSLQGHPLRGMRTIATVPSFLSGLKHISV